MLAGSRCWPQCYSIGSLLCLPLLAALSSDPLEHNTAVLEYDRVEAALFGLPASPSALYDEIPRSIRNGKLSSISVPGVGSIECGLLSSMLTTSDIQKGANRLSGRFSVTESALN